MPRVRTLTDRGPAVSALGLAGCSSSSSSPTTTTAPATPDHGCPGHSIPAADLSPAGTAGTPPTIIVPPAPPDQAGDRRPDHGTGPEAKAGDTVTVQYVLATYSSGRRSSRRGPASRSPSRSTPPEQVIPGWDKGVVGMQVGGRRELIIPPSLGYGDQSPGAGIAANDTLVFIVDLLKIN